MKFKFIYLFYKTFITNTKCKDINNPMIKANKANFLMSLRFRPSLSINVLNPWDVSDKADNKHKNNNANNAPLPIGKPCLDWFDVVIKSVTSKPF